MLSVNNHPVDEEAIETEFKRLLRVCLERPPAEEVQKQIPSFRRQNQALTDFIAELRKQAVMNEF